MSQCGPWQEIQKLMEEMIGHQHAQLYKLGQQFVPNLTEDDLLQPNDFVELENHPGFRYEEGILEGLRSMQMALQAWAKQRAKD